MRLLHSVVWALLSPALIAHAGEPDKLTTKRISVPRPAAKPVGKPLPRSVLFVQVAERGESVDQPSATSFYVYDPADSKAGLRKIFHGPSANQYCRFITPLFNGRGIAVGKLDAKKEPEGSRTMFWFDLLSGRIGPTIAEGTWCEGMTDTDVWFLSGALPASREAGDLTHINRYDCQRGTLTHYSMGFAHFHPLGRLSFLAVEKRERIVKVNLTKGTAEPLGELPQGGLPQFCMDEAAGVYPAGADCRDGIYCIRNFSLLFKPPKEDWRTVIESVNIIKTFGGRAPHLPVAYVGQGRFAVAKTTKDSVEVPKEKEKDFDGTPALSATMLIDGRTGKVLKQTKPQLYDNNPSLNIPDDWWSPDTRPAASKKQPATASAFQRNDADKTIRYAGNRRMTIADTEDATESADGRYLAVSGASNAKKAPARTILRVVDGKTGTITECPITADSQEVSVLIAAWQVLCPETPDKATLDAFRSSGFDYFQEPMANW